MNSRAVLLVVLVAIVLAGAVLLHLSRPDATVDLGTREEAAPPGARTNAPNRSTPPDAPHAPVLPEPGPVKPDDVMPADQWMPAGPIQITGQVTARETGRPVIAAEISVSPYGDSPVTVAKSGKDGGFRFDLSDWRHADVVVAAVHPEFDQWENQVNLRIAKTMHIRIRLARGASISGRVTDGESGNPVGMATIQVTQGGATEWGSSPRRDMRILRARADSAGRYRVAGMTPGKVFTVCAFRPGFASTSASFRLVQGEEKTIDLVLRQGVELRGMVRLPDWSPAEGARVRYVQPAERHRLNRPLDTKANTPEATDLQAGYTTTDSRGDFQITGIPVEAEFLLMVEKTGYAPALCHARTGEFMEVGLEKGSTLMVGVRRGQAVIDPRDLGEFQMTLVHEFGLEWSLWWRSDDDRRGTRHQAFSLSGLAVSATGLPRGSYEVRFEVDGYAHGVERDLLLDGHSVRNLTFLLEKAGFYGGVVTDQDTGTPISGAHVRVRASEGEGVGTTDGKGRFSVTGIQGDIEYVTVDRDGYGRRRFGNKAAIEKRHRFVMGDVIFDSSIRFEPDTKSDAFTLQRLGGVEVHLVAPENTGIPRRVTLHRSRDDGGSSHGATVDPGNLLTFSADAGVLLGIGVEAEGFAPAVTRDVTVKPGEVTRIDMNLSIGGAQATGTVRDEDTKAPVEGAAVMLVPAVSELGAEGITGDDGSFSFERLPSGRMRLIVRRDGYVDAYLEVTLGSQGRTRLPDVLLSRAGHVRGTVTDAQGRPVAQTAVWLAKNGKRTWWSAWTEGATGKYEIRNVEPGAYTVHGGETRSAKVTIVKGKSTQVNFELD